MGNTLPNPVTNKVVQCAGNQHFRAACCSMNGMREAMEDAHLLVMKDSYGLFGVFDGHCGNQCSNYCAEHLPVELENAKLPLSDKVVEELMLKIDREYRKSTTTAGSTACYCIATPKEGGKKKFDIQVVNVGDSRIIIGRNMGETCVTMTTDHKPSLKNERTRIEACGGTVSSDRVDGMLAMSRAMGDNEYKSGPGDELNQKVIALPDITHIECDADDFILIGCDGVFEGNFNNEEVIEYVREVLAKDKDDLASACCALAEECLRRGSTDNITCALVQFRDGSQYNLDCVIPGRFYPNKQSFAKAYLASLSNTKMTFAQALELRYDIIRKKMAERIAELKKDDTQEGQDVMLSQFTEELAMYKPGPAKNLTGAARSVYFEKLAETLSVVKDDGTGDEEDNYTQRVLEMLRGGMIPGVNAGNNAVASGGGADLTSLLKPKGTSASTSSNHQSEEGAKAKQSNSNSTAATASATSANSTASKGKSSPRKHKRK